MIYSFADYEIDHTLFELRRSGVRVQVEPKVFDVLAYLVAHRDRVISKDELFQKLWPGEFVTDSALTYCIRTARTALGDDGTQQRFIKTIHSRGYRFVAKVQPTAVSRPGAVISDQLAVSSTSKPETTDHAQPGFVGREREMHVLTAALGAAVAGHGRMVMLVGEPGIGKTRTAEELAAIARERDAQILVGRCYEGDGAPAFWPWVQIVRGYLRERDAAALRRVMGAAAADIAQIAPEVRELLSDAPTPPALEPEQGRFRLFDSMTTFLKKAGQDQPLVLILDDLHWADHSSLLLLQFVAREMHDARLLILGTYRDADFGRSHPLTQTLGDLARVAMCQRISLRGLKTVDVRHFIEATTGVRPADTLVAAVHRRTDGNPFFVTEIVRLLAAEHAGEPQASTASAVRIPQTVREAIARRLNYLSEACNRILHTASVIGREFDVTVLQRAGCVAPLALLDEAARARVIEEVPLTVGRYRFAHALVHEALSKDLSASERAHLHRRVGEALEELHATHLEPYYGTLAHHFQHAASTGDTSKAIDYAARAGERAASLLAYEAAVGHYEGALHLLERTPDERRRCTLLLALGDNQWKAGDSTRARDTFREAATLARVLRAPEQLAHAALGFGDTLRGFQMGVVDPALIDVLEDALHALGTADSALRARLLARLAVALYNVPDSVSRRNALSREAVEMAERSGDAAAQLAAVYSRHWAIWGPDSLDDRLAAAAQMVQLAEQLKDKEMAFHAHRFRFMDLLETGARADVEAAFGACAALAEELRQPYYLWYVASFQALRVFLEARFDDSERLAQEAAAIGQRTLNTNVSQIFGMQMYAVRKEQGRMAEIEAPARAFIAQYPTLPAWRAALAVICTEIGRADDARAEFEQLAADDFAGLPRDTFWLAAIHGLADVCAFLGDVRRAAPLFRLLEPYADRNVVMTPGTACSGSAARPLARLAALLGRWAEARRYFEQALSLGERLRARHFVAHAQCDYAEMLLAHAQPEDRHTATTLLAQAVATYSALHMDTFRARAAGLQEAASRGKAVATADRARSNSRVTVLRPRQRSG